MARPTDYNDEILERTKNFFLRYFLAEPYTKKSIQKKDGSIEQIDCPNPLYYKIPYKEQLALELDINDETIIEWAKIHNEFSATIKKIEQLQRVRLYDATMEKNSSTGAIFQLKVNHGKVETEKKILTDPNGESVVFKIVEDTKGNTEDKNS